MNGAHFSGDRRWEYTADALRALVGLTVDKIREIDR
jgi:hypothetical protein